MAGPTETKTETEISEREILITRTFDAPRERVWKAWTEADQVAEWFGPEGFTTRVEELDLRPGGTSRYVMIGPDGTEYPSSGVFQEVEPPERIVTTDEFDEDFPEAIEGIVLTMLFDEDGDRTRLTVRIAHQSAEDRRKHEEMGVVDGWSSSFDCLDEHLAQA